MADYIEREDLLYYIDHMPSELTSDGRRMIRRIRLTEYISDSIPAADVRPVVTCGECKYADSFTPTCTEATFPLKCLSIRYGGVYPDWFCEHGEPAQKCNCGADMREVEHD